LLTGIGIGLPPIMNFGSKLLQDKVVKDVLSGQQCICLCITEP
jgi:alkylation response protein AidB-like acyl-CoA dehydrogenase